MTTNWLHTDERLAKILPGLDPYQAPLLERLLVEHLEPCRSNAAMWACPYSGNVCSLKACTKAVCELDLIREDDALSGRKTA